VGEKKNLTRTVIEIKGPAGMQLVARTDKQGTIRGGGDKWKINKKRIAAGERTKKKQYLNK